MVAEADIRPRFRAGWGRPMMAIRVNLALAAATLSANACGCAPMRVGAVFLARC